MKAPQLIPRERRILEALLTLGRISREQLDGICGATNSPHYVHLLRARHGGRNLLLTGRVSMRDRDGRTVKPGVYSLAEDGGRAWAQALLSGAQPVPAGAS